MTLRTSCVLAALAPLPTPWCVPTEASWTHPQTVHPASAVAGPCRQTEWQMCAQSPRHSWFLSGNADTLPLESKLGHECRQTTQDPPNFVSPTKEPTTNLMPITAASEIYTWLSQSSSYYIHHRCNSHDVDLLSNTNWLHVKGFNGERMATRGQHHRETLLAGYHGRDYEDNKLCPFSSNNTPTTTSSL